MKAIGIILLIIIIVIVGGVLYLSSNSAPQIADFLTETLGTPVKVGSANLSLREIHLEDVSVANTQGENKSNALEIKGLKIFFDPASVLEKVIQINEVDLSGITIDLEMYNLTGSDNNWKQIIQRFRSSAAVLPSHVPLHIAGLAPLPQFFTSKQFQIDTLKIQHLKLQAHHKILGKFAVNFPIRNELVFHNLTNKSAVSGKQAIDLIFQTILSSVAQTAGLGQITNDIQIAPDLPKPSENSSPTESKEEEKQPSLSTSDQEPPSSFSWDQFKKDVSDSVEQIQKFFSSLAA